MEVQSTMDYSKFRLLKGNRVLNKNHIESIKSSIERNNLLPINPILVTKDLFVIDGQHRLMAATQLNVPIYYMIVENDDMDSVHVLNSVKKVWTLNDYVASFAELGKSEYTYIMGLVEEYKEYKFTPINVLRLLMGKVNLPMSRAVKAGTLEIEDKPKLEQQLRWLIDFKGVFPKYLQREFISAVRVLFGNPDYDHDYFIKRLQDGSFGRLKPMINTREYLSLFEDIYNYRNQTKKIRLF